MARRRSNVAWIAAGTAVVVLVALKLLVREASQRTGAAERSDVICELVGAVTPWHLQGWACLIPPVLAVLVLGIVIDRLSNPR